MMLGAVFLPDNFDSLNSFLSSLYFFSSLTVAMAFSLGVKLSIISDWNPKLMTSSPAS
jgi:hypothetical protein